MKAVESMLYCQIFISVFTPFFLIDVAIIVEGDEEDDEKRKNKSTEKDKS